MEWLAGFVLIFFMAGWSGVDPLAAVGAAVFMLFVLAFAAWNS